MNVKEIVKDDWLPMLTFGLIWLANGLYIRHLSIAKGAEAAFNYTFPIGGLIFLASAGLLVRQILVVLFRAVKYSYTSIKNTSKN